MEPEPSTVSKLGTHTYSCSSVAPKHSTVSVAPRHSTVSVAPKHSTVSVAPKHSTVSVAPRHSTAIQSAQHPTVNERRKTLLESLDEAKAMKRGSIVKKTNKPFLTGYIYAQMCGQVGCPLFTLTYFERKTVTMQLCCVT